MNIYREQIPIFHEIPEDAKITYTNLICDLRPLKDETRRVRIILGGNKLEYDGDPISPVVSLLNTKIFLNNVVSDAKDVARFANVDLENHFIYRAL